LTFGTDITRTAEIADLLDGGPAVQAGFSDCILVHYRGVIAGIIENIPLAGPSVLLDCFLNSFFSRPIQSFLFIGRDLSHLSFRADLRPEQNVLKVAIPDPGHTFSVGEERLDAVFLFQLPFQKKFDRDPEVQQAL